MVLLTLSCKLDMHGEYLLQRIRLEFSWSWLELLLVPHSVHKVSVLAGVDVRGEIVWRQSRLVINSCQVSLFLVPTF